MSCENIMDVQLSPCVHWLDLAYKIILKIDKRATRTNCLIVLRKQLHTQRDEFWLLFQFKQYHPSLSKREIYYLLGRKQFESWGNIFEP